MTEHNKYTRIMYHYVYSEAAVAAAAAALGVNNL